jgi:lysophospholipase L1-like esterase
MKHHHLSIANPRRLLVFGDSITEGCIAAPTRNRTQFSNGCATLENLHASPPVTALEMNDAQATYSQVLAAGLDAELGLVGWSSQGWLNKAYGQVPSCGVAWAHINGEHSRLPELSASPPDYILVNQGTNDAGVFDNQQVEAQVVEWLRVVRAAVGRSTWIFVVVPFGGYKRQALHAAVANYSALQAPDGDSRTFVLDLGAAAERGLGGNGDEGPWIAGETEFSCGGTHPLAARHAELGGMLLAAVFRAQALPLSLQLPPLGLAPHALTVAALKHDDDSTSNQLSMDYLIQDVCVDSAGVVLENTAGVDIDPASCMSHRDLQSGERLPYHKHDFDLETGVFYQLSDSFPLPHNDGTVRVLQTLDYADHGNSVRGLSYMQFDQGLDGFNANQAATEFVSIVGTEDPSCGRAGVQCPEYFVAPAAAMDGVSSCTLLDSWGLWGKDLFASPAGNNGSHLFRLNIQRGTPPSAKLCPSSYNAAFTEYDLLPSFTFHSGKTLRNVLRAQHWGGTSFADAKGGETEFFTREYGLTRWEAWQLDGHCGANHTAPCQPTFGLCGKDGARRIDAEGRHWVRDGCRDWTHISADPDGGYDPQRYPVSTALIAGANLLDNGDFGHTASPDTCGHMKEPPCTPAIGAHWKRSNRTNWSILKASNVTNFFLATNCIGGVCSSTGEDMIYQDVPLPASAAVGLPLSFGGHFWLGNDQGIHRQAQLSLLQLSADGTVIHETEARVEIVNSTSGRRRQHASGSGQVHDLSRTLRWRFTLPKQSDATYHMDNAFVSTTPFAKTDNTRRAAKSDDDDGSNTLTTPRPSAAQLQLMDPYDPSIWGWRSLCTSRLTRFPAVSNTIASAPRRTVSQPRRSIRHIWTLISG